jgi:diguanylate cyclase (GGDEF)-like protein
VKGVNVSAMMAFNTYIKDWVQRGEQDETNIKKYLVETKRQTNAYASFFISDITHNYYSSDAATKKVLKSTDTDAWYFKARTIAEPYQLVVERDKRYGNQWTIFVDYRMYDDAKKFIGFAGVGIQYDVAKQILENYEQRFKRKVYFVDKNGIVMLASAPDRPLGADIDSLSGIKDIKFDAENFKTRIHTYQLNNKQQFVIVRYIPEMNWYLIAEKSEADALENITQSLYRNLLLCFIITTLVVALTHLALKRYHLEVESAAAIDKLTGLPNRKAFDIGMSVLLQDSLRHKTNLGIMMMDLDYFKVINDTHGHLGGDYVLADAAEILKSAIRAEDFVCRWGGEEFVIVVPDCNEHNLMLLAEKIRIAIETKNFDYQQKHISVTISVGIATRKADEDVAHLIQRADKALYQAKSAGRNQSVSAA